METQMLKVDGMSCAHCENAVKTAVGALTGVSKVTVDLAAKTVTVAFDATKVNMEAIKNAIEDQGYDVL